MMTTACSTLSVVNLALLFVTVLLLAHVQSSPPPIQLQRRLSFFRCTGWGAGCSNLDYPAWQPSRPKPRRHQQQDSSKHRAPSSSRGSLNGLHFLFTSGTSWGANRKRSQPSVSTNSEVSILYNIINELRNRQQAAELQ